MTHKLAWQSLSAVVVAALALVLGTVGTATAQGVTVKAVKKIAVKVVKKQAPHLAVASAGNAGTVGGLAPSALQERRSVYSLDLPSAVHSFTRTVPLPGPGSYEISYSIYLNNAGGAGSECWLERDDSALALIQYYASDASASTSLRNGHSATDVITVGAGEVVKFGCALDGAVTTFTTLGYAPAHVVVTKLDAVVTGTL